VRGVLSVPEVVALPVVSPIRTRRGAFYAPCDAVCTLLLLGLSASALRGSTRFLHPNSALG